MNDTIKAFVEFLTQLFAALAKFLGLTEEYEEIVEIVESDEAAE